jgi:hypothetical protein
LETAVSGFRDHKPIDILVKNGKYVCFPNGSHRAVTSGDTGGLWQHQVPGQRAGVLLLVIIDL